MRFGSTIDKTVGAWFRNSQHPVGMTIVEAVILVGESR
jgi:hypothetical protein